MSRHITVLLFIFLLSNLALGQNLDWVLTYYIEQVSAISTDDSGNVYVVGHYRGKRDLDPSTLGTDFYTSNSSKDDPFLTKFDANGKYQWSITLSGPNYDEGIDVWVDDSSNVFITGNFSGTMDFDPGPGVHNLTVKWNDNVFVLKLDRNGLFKWARSFGDGGLVNVEDMKLDDQGNIYTTGYFYNDADFDPGADTFELFNPFSNRDIFVSKLDANGDFVWAVSAGSRSLDCAGYALTLMNNDQIAITGIFAGTVDFDPDTSTADVTSFSTNRDGFIWILDTGGNYVNAMDIASGIGTVYVYDITSDSKNNMYVVGNFNGKTDFDPNSRIARELSPLGGSDGFAAKYDSTGAYDWAIALGGKTTEYVNQIKYGDDGLLSIVGRFKDTVDFDPGPDSNKVFSKSNNMFLLRLTAKSEFHSVHHTGTIDTNGAVTPHDFHIGDSGQMYVVGLLSRSTDMDMSSDTHIVSTTGSLKFIMKMQSCDSLTYDSLTVSACKSYTSPSGNHVWTKTGIYTDILSGDNQYGCDSVITIDLTVSYDVDTSITDTVCGFMTSPSGKYTWDTSGTYYDTVTTKVGCDTSYTFNLTVLPVKDSTWSQTVCDSLRSPSGRYWWTTTGVYVDTIAAENGCDSIITINLTVNPSSLTSIFPSTCGPYKSPSGRYTWSTSGTYSDTLVNQLGCDSVLTIYLTAQSPSFAVIDIKECTSYTSPSGKYTWNISGIYRDTLVNSVGCDSIMIINLTITRSPLTIENYVSCSSVTSPGGLYTWTTSGTYYDTLTNRFSCDSIIEAHVTINLATAHTIQISTCDLYRSPSGKYTWTQSGTYLDTIRNNSGCDSVITIDLTIGKATQSTINPTVCNGYRSPSGKYFWTTSGLYSDTITNQSGCDSVIDVVLTIQTSNHTVHKESSCGPFKTSDGRMLETSGIYSDTLVNQYGCDSILTIDLEVITIDTSLYLLDDLLIANATTGRFQWLDCENNLSAISGATGRAFAYDKSGVYAVEIFDGFCLDTSSCVSVHSSSIGLLPNGIKVYPNPTNGQLFLELTDVTPHTSYTIYSSTGQVVSKGLVTNKVTALRLHGTQGIYTLELTSERTKSYIKLVKQ